jgi:aminoglycoside phosphotransferase (APT) family kinase protein
MDVLLTLIATSGIGEPLRIERIEQGYSHFVCAVTTRDGGEYVMKVASEQRKHLLDGAMYWHEWVQSRAPTADLVHACLNSSSGFSYLLYRKLAGTDLFNVIGSMSGAETNSLATEIAGVHASITSIPAALGYGGVLSHHDQGCFATWGLWIDNAIESTASEAPRTGLHGAFSWLRARNQALSSYWQSIAPVAFLEDCTLRNVMVEGGRLIGVVDFDEVSFGDPLVIVGGVKAELTMLGLADTFALELGTQQFGSFHRDAMEFYAVLAACRRINSRAQYPAHQREVLIDWLAEVCS